MGQTGEGKGQMYPRHVLIALSCLQQKNGFYTQNKQKGGDN